MTAFFLLLINWVAIFLLFSFISHFLLLKNGYSPILLKWQSQFYQELLKQVDNIQLSKDDKYVS